MARPKSRKWRRRVQTSTIKLERMPSFTFADPVFSPDACFYGALIVDNIYEDQISNRAVFHRWNFTMGRAEAVSF